MVLLLTAAILPTENLTLRTEITDIKIFKKFPELWRDY